MRREVRRKIEMGVRVRNFMRAHPFPDPGSTAVEAKFEERLARAEALAAQALASDVAARAANVRRIALRKELGGQLLRHLIRVVLNAQKEHPELLEKFRMPSSNATNLSFLTSARILMKEAEAQREVLLGLGMTEPMFEELAKAAGQFEEAMTTALAARSDRVGAHADLATVTSELVRLVGLLEGLNQLRYRTDAELRAMWESARNVIGPFRSKDQPFGEEGGETAPPDGGAREAA